MVQVECGGVGLTAKNSTSLQRALGPPSLSVKGDPTNYPFWPGEGSGCVSHQVVSEGGKVLTG